MIAVTKKTCPVCDKTISGRVRYFFKTIQYCSDACRKEVELERQPGDPTPEEIARLAAEIRERNLANMPSTVVRRRYAPRMVSVRDLPGIEDE